MKQNIGIYIHIPFCRKACHYCDFHFSTLLKYKNDFIDALLAEIKLRSSSANNYLISTIYFGGGTPSILSAKELETIINAIKQSYNTDHNVEITLELNPEDGNLPYLKALKSSGINRLSIGCQTFSDKLLLSLNRNHTAEESKSVVLNAKSVGFDSLSLDLIYGIVGSTNDSFQHDLNEIISLDPSHISAYALTVEPNTVFGNWKKNNKFSEINDHQYIDQYNELVSRLNNNNYEQYEISNFAKPGKHSKHNTSYWFNQPYLGFGPGAHSYLEDKRYHNISNNAKYIKALKTDELPLSEEKLTRDEKINEFILTRLRTKWGLSIDELKEKFNYSISQQTLNKHTKNQNVINISNVIFLSKEGKLLADEISMDFFV